MRCIKCLTSNLIWDACIFSLTADCGQFPFTLRILKLRFKMRNKTNTASIKLMWYLDRQGRVEIFASLKMIRKNNH